MAWVAGGLAFVSPFAALSASPKPSTTSAANTADEGRRVIIVRTITRRVVIRDAPKTPQVHYVYVGGGSSGSSGSSGGSGPVAAPPPPPTTSTSGS
jgi:hypothetical protein